ncbi:MAG TPA: restriction endonuclease [Candidatus Hydrogenedentes bacterium]|nr:restriction endonuclease [Candidatus Hydrogenedentota bacterium]HPC15121.1 restriction endonuclease [Candidatus Hydrogenedentota bacterium]HRT21857.1 restriction endonuclease [Candidatus Hydrogenedentota bacterium]HRT64120.1 restriction endonuclease [Candidatus Hydrogenedentota bacterium]
MNSLTVALLKREAQAFAQLESQCREPSLFGVTDGKAVGTYLEHKFQTILQEKYGYVRGSSAKGIDFPEFGVDIKVTSVRQPQSSCPFKSARQKVYGLGYSLLVFVYDKTDNLKTRTATLDIKHVIFVEASRTADYQTTSGLLKILDNAGNLDDVIAFITERFLPVDEIQANELASEILRSRPEVGCLTISNALQWRLQYTRAIEQAGTVAGVERLA